LMKSVVRNRLLLLAVFAIAMAYLEASVVIYLRTIFYPQGFDFPIKRIPIDMAVIELAREVATIAMLIAVAFLAEQTRRGRLVSFMFLFGIWDIFYYVWLRVAIGWPPSLLTWDLLFLVPVIWTGPVVAPVLVSILMIAASNMYFKFRDLAERLPIATYEWMIVVGAAFVIFLAFAYNHGVTFRGELPGRFPWEIFASGMALGLWMLTRLWRRLHKLRLGIKSG